MRSSEVSPGVLRRIVPVALPDDRIDLVDVAIRTLGSHRRQPVPAFKEGQQPVFPRPDMDQVVFDRPPVRRRRREGGRLDLGRDLNQVLPDGLDLFPDLVGGHDSAILVASAITLSSSGSGSSRERSQVQRMTPWLSMMKTDRFAIPE